MGRLVAVNVGLPRDVTWRGETVHTAVWKQPVQGRQMVRRLNIDGDGQGDLAGHGGEHRAVMVYQMDSYRYWETQLGRHDFSFGQFGENFTVEGLPDSEVCIGDRYRIGSALFEVTQPRVTCYRVGIRLNETAMASLLVSHHRPGFYLRVLEEGEVGADDEISKVAEGPERMSVAEIDALLYLPGHPRDRLKSALRIPALSSGWQSSFQALLDQNGSQAGNPGLTGSIPTPPAWQGFRDLRIAKIDRETADVISLSCEPVAGAPLPAALPGQFLVLRLSINSGGPPLLRNYSLSGAPGATGYRVSIKHEIKGAASSYLHTHAKPGDVLQASAPRGSFTLRAGDGPVVLLSAGIGATPVLAMLHSLASTVSKREVWWLYGARNRSEHPFAKEAQGLVQYLSHARSHIVYSRPGPEDQMGVDYDSVGHWDVPLLEQLGVNRSSDFYLCGPTPFLTTLTAKLGSWGVDPSRIHSEFFGAGESMTPGIAASARLPVHPPRGNPGSGPQVSFTRSGLTVPWSSSFQSLLELAEACDVPVRWSCRTGVCHSCECALIGGDVDYQPTPLDPPGPGNLLICCSQPRGDIQVDL